MNINQSLTLAEVNAALGTLANWEHDGRVLASMGDDGHPRLILGVDPAADYSLREDRRVAEQVAERLTTAGMRVDADALGNGLSVRVSRRPGRPAEGVEVTARLPQPLLHQVQAWADQRQVSRAEAVRQLVARGLTVNGR
jgi:hypothetical protein